MVERVLDGKYKLGGVLSQSDRAVVLDAIHVDLRERVAVKILQREHSDPRFAARLRREARQATQIKSEHVVRYLDIGHLADGRPYVVMERLIGEPLSARIARAPLSLTEAVDTLLETCEALASAHVRGIVHRDLRTSNLFRVERPDQTCTIKVLNFGTGRTVDPRGGGQEDEGLTVAALALDAPDYKAPEQISARRDLDARVDIWSLGVVFYEILTGRHPFKGDTLQDTLKRLLAADPPRAPEIPRLAWDAIARCLKVSRDGRWADVADLADALAPLAARTTARYPTRVRQILETAPSMDVGVAFDEGHEPTVVRDVLALASGSTLTTLAPAVGLRIAETTSELPRLDDGRTGARSFPWLELPVNKPTDATLDPRKDPDQSGPISSTNRSAATAVLIIAGVAVVLVTVLLLLKRVVIDVHVGATDPRPAASSVAAAPPLTVTLPATTPALPSQPEPEAPASSRAESSSAPNSTAAPSPPVEIRPAPAARPSLPPRAKTPAAAPPPGGTPDPWGWER